LMRRPSWAIHFRFPGHTGGSSSCRRLREVSRSRRQMAIRSRPQKCIELPQALGVCSGRYAVAAVLLACGRKLFQQQAVGTMRRFERCGWD
jgi:hypothetical protein